EPRAGAPLRARSRRARDDRPPRRARRRAPALVLRPGARAGHAARGREARDRREGRRGSLRAPRPLVISPVCSLKSPRRRFSKANQRERSRGMRQWVLLAVAAAALAVPAGAGAKASFFNCTTTVGAIIINGDVFVP